MDSPFFSIIIPVFNRADSIQPAIDSCLNQSFSDFELLIVDDGSSDGLKAKIEELQAFHAKIKYTYQDNAGGAAARNLGIAKSTGKFVAFLDSDDLFVKDKLAIVHAEILRNQASDLVLCSKLLVDRGVGKYWVKPPRSLQKNERASDFVMADRGFLQTSTLVVEAELAKRTLFQQGLPFGQDTDFVVRLEQNSATFLMLSEPLVIWNDIQASDRVSNGKDYRPILAWLDSLKHFISPRAYYTYKGFHIARLARKDSLLLGYKFLFSSLLTGKMNFKVALVSFLQVTLSREQYRCVADTLVKLAGK